MKKSRISRLKKAWREREWIAGADMGEYRGVYWLAFRSEGADKRCAY
ncbi:MAG: hypothetical protein V1494_01930 [Candidatus Diapherotrites archaeon]